tara:strand:- start:9057 stop:9293 length:237 start_codon:yes stop_codon:yes gene_type:complete
MQPVDWFGFCSCVSLAVFLWAVYRRFVCRWSWNDIVSEMLWPFLMAALFGFGFGMMLAFAKAAGLVFYRVERSSQLSA